MSEVILFGGTGMFGRAIASELRSNGRTVRVATRRAESADRAAVQVDLRSVPSIAKAAAGAGAVVICMPLSDGPRAGFVPERDGVRNIWKASDFLTGCPVSATVTDDPGMALMPVCAKVYQSWIERLEVELVRDEAVDGRSRALAIVSPFEGALLLDKAFATTEPITSVIHSVIDQPSPPRQ